MHGVEARGVSVSHRASSPRCTHFPMTPDPRLTARDRVRFTCGDCHYLARALHLRTDWPLCAFDHGGPDLHAFVRMPDGRYLDVEGPRTRAALRKRWETDEPIGEFAWSDFREFGLEFGSYSRRRARVVAERLLAAYAPEALSE